jgi:uncharacterized protein (DUF1015 family)
VQNLKQQMITIRPFHGYRPPTELADKVASKPYDVLDSNEAREEMGDNEYSFFRINKPEVDLSPDIDPYADEVYAQGRKNLELFVERNWLIKDEKPGYYIYRQKMGDHEQTGLVAGSWIEDYFEDRIKKHEFTRPKKENDRIRHMATLGAHVGPVFLTYPASNEIDEVISSVTGNENPTYHFDSGDGVIHTFWTLFDEAKVSRLTDLFSRKVPASYIADGHHRAASSAKVGLQLKENNSNHRGDEDYNFFLSVLFPDNQLQIIDYNRVITDLNGHGKEDFLSLLSGRFDVEKLGKQAYKPEHLHSFGMYLDGVWFKLTAHKEILDDEDPIGVLDVTVLSKNVLDPILGIKDQRTDERIDFVGGIRGMKELERRVDSGEMKLAFSIYPVTVQQLIDIANSGEVMPPKSTWFEPKLRSGLIIHRFEE